MRKIPFSPPDISEAEIEEVVDTLRSGWITTGPKTKLFENTIADYCGTNKSVALSSATACMEMVLRLLGVSHGDEVITTAYTYTASASVAHHVGAKIVLVDTLTGSYHMDPAAVEAAITDKTKVIIPVDIGGVLCDYEGLYEAVQNKKHLFTSENEIHKALGRVAILADSAHGFGASQNNKRSGSIADFTCFSFHAVKNLTTAEGGAVTWKPIGNIEDEAIYKQFMLFSLHGQSKDALAKTKAGMWEYDIVAPLYKCNMTDIQASLGLAQFQRYSHMLNNRKKIVRAYDRMISELGLKSLDHMRVHQESSYHLYLVDLVDKGKLFRNRLIEELAIHGVSTNVHYKPLPLLSAYKNLGYKVEDYPNAYERFQNEITLPLYSKLSDDDVQYIIETFKMCYRELERPNA